MPTLHRATVGSAFLTLLLAFYLEDTQKFKWMLLPIAGSLFLVFDDLVFHLSDGKYGVLKNVWKE